MVTAEIMIKMRLSRWNGVLNAAAFNDCEKSNRRNHNYLIIIKTKSNCQQISIITQVSVIINLTQ